MKVSVIVMGVLATLMMTFAKETGPIAVESKKEEAVAAPAVVEQNHGREKRTLGAAALVGGAILGAKALGVGLAAGALTASALHGGYRGGRYYTDRVYYAPAPYYEYPTYYRSYPIRGYAFESWKK